MSHFGALFRCGKADLYLCLGGRAFCLQKGNLRGWTASRYWKDLQYTDGIPHEESSAQIAVRILPDCEFSREEQEIIVDLILTHRKKKKACKARLNELFYKADKGSRNCLICPASSQCSWSDEKKNLKIHY